MVVQEESASNSDQHGGQQSIHLTELQREVRAVREQLRQQDEDAAAPQQLLEPVSPASASALQDGRPLQGVTDQLQVLLQQHSRLQVDNARLLSASPKAEKVRHQPHNYQPAPLFPVPIVENHVGVLRHVLVLQGKASERIAQLEREVAAGTLANEQLHRDLEVSSCPHLPFCAILVALLSSHTSQGLCTRIGYHINNPFLCSL